MEHENGKHVSENEMKSSNEVVKEEFAEPTITPMQTGDTAVHEKSPVELCVVSREKTPNMSEMAKEVTEYTITPMQTGEIIGDLKTTVELRTVLEAGDNSSINIKSDHESVDASKQGMSHKVEAENNCKIELDSLVSLTNKTVATAQGIENTNDSKDKSYTQTETSTDAPLITKEIPAVELAVECTDKIANGTGVMKHATNKSINDLKVVLPSSLSLLAQYNSDDSNDEDDDNDIVEANVADTEDNGIQISDSESVCEVPTNISSKDYRDQVYEITSDSEDSDSSSSSSSSNSDSPGKYLQKIRKNVDKAIEIVDGDDDNEEDGDEISNRRKKRQPPKARGEMLLEDLPQIKDLHITVPEEQCIELGRIHSIVEQLVLVSVLPNSVLLDLDTVLFLDKGKKVLGEVFDVLGQIADPLYCIRFNSNQQIMEKEIKLGDVVYVAPKTQYTQFVILSNLTKVHGSDASWENDVEPPPQFLDYSDDEQERAARARLRNKDRVHHEKVDDGTTKRVRSDSYQCDSSTTSASTSSAAMTRCDSHRGGRGYYHRNKNNHNNNFNNASHNYNNNCNMGSWHSNYHHNNTRMSIPNYRFPLPQPPMPYINYGNPRYATPPLPPPPPPMPQFRPYQQMLPSPMYVLNPYAIRPGVLPAYHTPKQEPEPKPPGSS